MKLKQLSSIMVGAAVMFITLTPMPQIHAATQNPVASAATKSSSTNSSSFVNDILNFFSELGNFFQNIPGAVGQALNDALGDLGIPDLISVLEHLEDTSTSSDDGAKLSEALESRESGSDKGSFSIRHDLAKQAVREAAMGMMNATALSKKAQQRMVQQAQIAQQAVMENAQLAEESQSLDVTQQILQNVSKQTALNGQVNQQMFEEAQQARIDRAISNTLTAQIAEEISAANVAERRQATGTANMSAQHLGLISLPGGYYLGAGANSSTSTSN